MEDRFKFRAWDIENKKHISDCDRVYRLLIGGDNSFIYEQCTGLKDKNGKLIYEGDILVSDDECFREKYKVEFWQRCSQFLLAGINTTGGAFGIIEQNSLEVAGNIHENPELLEEK